MRQAAELGRRAEAAVADYLVSQGYRICARNYLVPRLGELDLVAWKESRLTVIEVKARTNADNFGGLPATITAAKIRRLRQATWCYLKEMQLLNTDVSFLAALVKIMRDGNIGSIEIMPIECF